MNEPVKWYEMAEATKKWPRYARVFGDADSGLHFTVIENEIGVGDFLEDVYACEAGHPENGGYWWTPLVNEWLSVRDQAKFEWEMSGGSKAAGKAYAKSRLGESYTTDPLIGGFINYRSALRKWPQWDYVIRSMRYQALISWFLAVDDKVFGARCSRHHGEEARMVDDNVQVGGSMGYLISRPEHRGRDTPFDWTRCSRDEVLFYAYGDRGAGRAIVKARLGESESDKTQVAKWTKSTAWVKAPTSNRDGDWWVIQFDPDCGPWSERFLTDVVSTPELKQLSGWIGLDEDPPERYTTLDPGKALRFDSAVHAAQFYDYCGWSACEAVHLADAKFKSSPTPETGRELVRRRLGEAAGSTGWVSADRALDRIMRELRFVNPPWAIDCERSLARAIDQLGDRYEYGSYFDADHDQHVYARSASPAGRVYYELGDPDWELVNPKDFIYTEWAVTGTRDSAKAYAKKKLGEASLAVKNLLK